MLISYQVKFAVRQHCIKNSQVIKNDMTGKIEIENYFITGMKFYLIGLLLQLTHCTCLFCFFINKPLKDPSREDY